MLETTWNQNGPRAEKVTPKRPPELQKRPQNDPQSSKTAPQTTPRASKTTLPLPRRTLHFALYTLHFQLCSCHQYSPAVCAKRLNNSVCRFHMKKNYDFKLNLNNFGQIPWSPLMAGPGGLPRGSCGASRRPPARILRGFQKAHEKQRC